MKVYYHDIVIFSISEVQCIEGSNKYNHVSVNAIFLEKHPHALSIVMTSVLTAIVMYCFIDCWGRFQPCTLALQCSYASGKHHVYIILQVRLWVPVLKRWTKAHLYRYYTLLLCYDIIMSVMVSCTRHSSIIVMVLPSSMQLAKTINSYQCHDHPVTLHLST